MAHSFDNQLRYTGNASPTTTSYVCGSGATVLVVGIVTAGSTIRSGGTPTYNSRTMTQIETTQTNLNTSIELWYLINPSIGSNTLSVPNTGSRTLHLHVSSHKAGEGYGSSLYSSDSSQTIQVAILVYLLAGSGRLLIASMASDMDYLPLTETPAVSFLKKDNGTYVDAAIRYLPTSSYLESIEWAWDINPDNKSHAVVGASFEEAAGGITVTPDALELTATILPRTVTGDDFVAISAAAFELTAAIVEPGAPASYTFEATTLELTGAIPDDPTVTSSCTYLHLLRRNRGLLTMERRATATVLVDSVSVIVPSFDLTAELNDPVANTSAFIRMVDFVYSTDIAYEIEFGDEYARFYYDGALLKIGATPVEIVTPYGAEDLRRVQFRQIGDTMWCVHPDYAPRKLTRTSATSFSLDAIEFEDGPFLTRNDYENDESGDDLHNATMTCTATVAGSSGTLTCSEAIFESGHVGSLFKLVHPKSDLSTTGTATTTGVVGDVLSILGDYSLSIKVSGFLGTVILQKSNDGWSTSTTVYTLTKNISEVKSYTHEGSELTDGYQYRVNVTALTAGSLTATLTVKSNSVTGKMTGSNTGVVKIPLEIKGGFTFTTHGTWTGTVILEREENEAGWEPYRTVTSNDDNNASITGDELLDNVRYRINVTSHTSGTITVNLVADESTKTGIVKIDSVTSSTEAEVTVLKAIAAPIETKRWAEGAWSGVQGYPRALCFFNGRCVYGGTSSDMMTVWLSKVDDYDSFEEGEKDDDSFSLAIPSTNEIMWIEALRSLCVGTNAGEWTIESSRIEAPLTPTNYNVRQQSSYGSAPMAAVRFNDVVMFVDRTRRRLREMTYRYDVDKFVSPDLVALAEHITESGIVDMAVQKSPDTVLWCVLADGSLISLTYEREQNVVGWSRHPMSGTCTSVSVIPGGGDDDEVWISVVRRVGTSYKVYVERMEPRDFGSMMRDCFFFDCGITKKSSTASTSVTGLSHLEGESVIVLADGAVQGPFTVAGGAITLTTAAKVKQIGLPMSYKLQPMRIDINVENRSTHGSLARIGEVAVSFMDTVNAKYGRSDDELYDIPWTSENWENTSEITGLFTGDIALSFDGGFGRDNPIIITGDDPLPCTVRCIVARLDVTGR